ncbi:hypothetical protein WDW89_22340 [Deltaproteobacteria bacterium TL4]
MSLQVEESEKTLPDESDQIISDLEHQLELLQSKLSQYESEKRQILSGKKQLPTEQNEELQKIQLQIKREQVTSLLEQQTEYYHRSRLFPKVMGQLREPIESITSNLDQVIAKINDPDVSSVLRQCKNMAVSMIQRVQQLHDHSIRLDKELVPVKKQVNVLNFFKSITHKLNSQNKSAKLLVSPEFIPVSDLDESLFIDAIMLLLKEISRISQEDVIKITLRQGNRRIYNVDKKQVEVSMYGETDWELIEDREMHEFLQKAFNTSQESGLDLLYAKKIIEKHGGNLSFYREQGKVVGFEINLPLVED